MTRQFRSSVKFRLVITILILCLLTAGGCGSARVAPKSSGVDENLIRLNRSARIAYDNGQLEQAASLYRQALDRAYLRDDRQAGDEPLEQEVRSFIKSMPTP